MGSHVFAESLKARQVTVELMIALDLVGYFSEAPRSQHFPHPLLRIFYPSRGDFIAVVGDLRAGPWIRRVKQGMLSVQALPVQSFRAPAWLAPVHFSDHSSFRRLGLPGVLITDTAFMRYPYYHTAEDTPEKLNYERMGQLVRALHGVLYEGDPLASD
jgi:Zn-dependent M28 family amino/carboxypeptidase